ncbi:MAG: putative transport system ATP-binding protein [Solirubrobacteraceae bacterium]|nr:putative transport system ATP-binding protein [Solirubrobacteraceae bacterium]
MSAVLEAESLYRFYHAGDDETLALRGVSLAVAAGEMVAVTGPSGSGKSTLLSCLAGLDEPSGGMVRVAGRRLSRRPESERAALRASHIGMLFQTANLVEHLDVAENVALAQRLAAPVAGDCRPAVAELLAHVGLQGRTHARPSQLSGGELACAGLAVALANRPAVLLADEPTGELDATTAQRVLALLRRRADDGGAVVVVTHNPAVAAAADRTVELADGRVVA